MICLQAKHQTSDGQNFGLVVRTRDDGSLAASITMLARTPDGMRRVKLTLPASAGHLNRSGRPRVHTVEAVCRLIQPGEAIGFNQWDLRALAAGIKRSTCHRLIRAAVQQGAVCKTRRKYSLPIVNTNTTTPPATKDLCEIDPAVRAQLRPNPQKSGAHISNHNPKNRAARAPR